MAVEYKGPKAVLPIMMEGSIKPGDYWEDFRSKVLQEDSSYDWMAQYDKNFSSVTKDWDEAKYKKFLQDNGITDAVLANTGTDLSQMEGDEAVTLYKRILGSMVIDKKGHFSNIKYKLSGTEISNLRKDMQSYDAHEKLVANLEEKGGTPEQIQAVIGTLDQTKEGYTKMLDDVGDLQGEDWESYVTENFAKNILPENSWGDEATGFQIPQEEIAAQNPPDPVELAEDAVTNFTFGPSDINTLLQNDGYIGDGTTGEEGKYYTADGREVVKNSAGRISYVDDPDEEWTPEGTGVEAQTEAAQEQKEQAEAVVSDAVETTGQAVDTAAGIENAYVGGDVSPEAANALGWTKNPDGSFTDPSNPGTTYIIGDDGNLVDKADPTQTATTEGMMNFDENDFAGRSETIINDFLYGAQVTPDNAQDYGFSFDPNTNTYTSPDGTVYQDVGGQLQDENGVPIERSHGFTNYQSALEGAAEEYTKQMTGLRTQYDQTFSEYEGKLEPYLQQQENITSGLMGVASDAGDENYYSRLKDVYFADAAEGIQTDTDDSRDQLQQMYARSGADPNSPAYTAAIMDLQEKRGDAMRSARRKAMLDSYELGNNMLQNRSSTLSNAQTGLGNSMNALGGLYDVKIKGLEVDRDMISGIYKGKQNEANIGVQGLNTVAGQRQSIVDSDKKSFYGDIDLRTGLNKNTQSSATTAANTAGAADTNATNDIWTNVNWMQTLAENDMNWRATGAAMQTQFPDYDFKGNLDPKLYNQLFPEGT